MNHPEIENIQNKIAPLRLEIINHPVYKIIKTPQDMCVFMEHHIYAVWDFMSLLKALQIHLTSTNIPWFPKGDGEVRFFINEVVVGEESDVDFYGNRKSHFEMYLDAMEQSGASTLNIERFVSFLKKNSNLDSAFVEVEENYAVSEFVKHTFEVIKTAKPHLMAAVFTFGREDLIPDMFLSMVSEFKTKFPDKFSLMNYYLERHIEIDGDHHSILALKMIENLCGNDPKLWQEALEIAQVTLKKRNLLWDSIYKTIMKKKIINVL
jgi:hypothetical protein